METLCRDCLAVSINETDQKTTRCKSCASPRLISHPELSRLSTAHMDCDAFYASVEKRDNPELNGKPLIIGGGTRGVVSTCCYIARLSGVRSAMPMFKALKACPEAVVLPPNMQKYKDASLQIRSYMNEITPLIEPLSLDEAFLDLTGTERLHGRIPAATMAKLALDIENNIGVTVSVGLAANKFLAKIASDLDKPRGFSIIGAAEAESFLGEQPVSILWGVGKAMQKSLAREGIRKVKDIRRYSENELLVQFGQIGLRLYDLCRARDARKITANAPAKSISAETTFNKDTADLDTLEKTLWRLSERCSASAKKAEKSGRVVTLKMKTSNFQTVTRRQSLPQHTQMADILFQTSRDMLRKYYRTEKHPPLLRLIGVGLSGIGHNPNEEEDLFIDPVAKKNAKTERAMDALRGRFGKDAIKKGRSL